MKSKNFMLTIASILSLVFVLGLTSAATVNVSNINFPSDVPEDQNSFDFSFDVQYTGTSDNMTISFDDSTTSLGTISIPDSNSLNGSEDESQTITGTISGIQDQGGQTVNVVINASTTDGSYDSLSFSTDITNVEPNEPEEITECSLIGNLGGNLDIKIDDITVTKGFGDDEEYWYPLDTIELEIEVENNGNEEIQNIEVGWGIYDKEEKDWIIDEEENDFDLDEDEEEVVTVEFTLEDADDYEDIDELVLYVWAIGEDEEFDDNDTCISTSETIDITNNDDFVVIDDLQITPEPASCGSTVDVTADLWNVGDNEQEDVKIRAKIRDLDYDEEIMIGDINEFDSEKLNMNFEIPEDAEEKTYALVLEVFDEDDDIFETDEEEDEARFTYTFDVQGNCQADGSDGQDGQGEMPNVVISANLVSGGNAGEQLVISSDITNTATEKNIYAISAEGYESWAQLESAIPGVVNLETGDSEEVVFKFNVDKEVSGEKTFNIVVTGQNQESIKQPVQVSITEDKNRTGFFEDGLDQNTIILILVVLIAVVVILIIIVLIMRAVKK